MYLFINDKDEVGLTQINGELLLYESNRMEMGLFKLKNADNCNAHSCR